MASDDIDDRFDPLFQRGHEEDSVAFAPRVVAGPLPEPVTESAPSLRGNPWVVVLWVLALLFSAGGLWMQWYSQMLYATPDFDSATTYYVIPAVLQALSPWLLGVGLATLAGVVFLHAVRWRRP